MVHHVQEGPGKEEGHSWGLWCIQVNNSPLPPVLVFASYSSTTSMREYPVCPVQHQALRTQHKWKTNSAYGKLISQGESDWGTDHLFIPRWLTSCPRHWGGIKNTKSLLCGTPMPMGRDREQTDHIVTSKTDKRMKKTGQCERLTTPDKAPVRNNFRMWTMESDHLGSNSDSAFS